jgi:ACS family tartrate transporter-like MFS transporter
MDCPHHVYLGRYRYGHDVRENASPILAGWQWLFFVEGLLAVLLSILFLTYLPDKPAEAKWLTEEERNWIQSRLQGESSAGVTVHREGVGRALLDPRVWLLGLFYSCIMACGYAYLFSAPAIIQKLQASALRRSDSF